MEEVKDGYSNRISLRTVKCVRRVKSPERFKNLTNNAKKVDGFKNEVVSKNNSCHCQQI